MQSKDFFLDFIVWQYFITKILLIYEKIRKQSVILKIDKNFRESWLISKWWWILIKCDKK